MELEKASREAFPKTWETLERGLADGVTPGFVAGVYDAKNPSKPAQTFVLGHSRLEPSQQEMGLDSIFDIASVSKVFSTATLLAVMVEKGWLDWETPVSSILEDFPHRDIQVVHLAAHSSGQLWWNSFYETLKANAASQGKAIWEIPFETRQNWMRELVFAQPLVTKPGEKFVYSDLTFMTLGFLLEEVCGMPMDQAVRQWVWNPMGISGAHYRRIAGAAGSDPDTQSSKYVATERCPWRGAVLQGQVHDDNCWSMGGVSGHAGVFATLKDLMIFGQKHLSGFLPESTLRVAWSPVTPPWGPADSFRTPGWDMPSGLRPSLGTRFSKNSVGHLGFTGTSFWMDPDRGLAVALLSNRVHPSRANEKIKTFRADFHDALAQDLGI